MAKVRGAKIIARSLKNLGVDTIFYIIGGPINPVAEEAHALGIKLVDVRHEECAAMAAHAYARLSRKPGVVLTPSGPATANAIPGVVNALADASPIIALGGSTALYQRGMGAFQEMDQVALMAPATKWAFQVSLAHRIPEQFSQAFRRAMTGCKGPVYIDLPADVIETQLDDTAVHYDVEAYKESRPWGNPEDVKQAIAMLRKAEKPIIISGSGVLWSDASEELRAFVDATGIPFYTTPQGRGVIPEDHPRCFTAARTTAFKEADVVLAVATRSNFILSYFRPPRWDPNTKVIMVNIDAEEVHHNKNMAGGIVGDAKMVLRQLAEEARGKFDATAETAWVKQLRAKNAANEEKNEALLNSNAVPIHPLRMMKEVRETIARDAIVVVDGHDTLNFGRQSIPTFVPGHRLNAGTHGTMGIGVPFALGAKAAKPDKQVVLVCGDGSFGWSGMNIDSAVRNKLPFVAVINNNGGMTAASRGQPEDLEKVRQHDFGWSDYQMIAQAFGGYGERVEKPDQIKPALRRALSSGKAAVVNVVTDHYARSSTYSGFFGAAGEYS